VIETALLLAGRVDLPRRHVGWRLRLRDGTAATVYRETIVDLDPAVTSRREWWRLTAVENLPP
jgi:hypothetical protein